LKGSKKKRSIQDLDNAYLEAIGQEDLPIPEVGATPSDQEIKAEVPAPEPSPTPKPLPDAPTPPSCPLDEWDGKGLVVADDWMSVTLQSSGGIWLSAEAIRQALARLGISHGIDEEGISQAVKATKSGNWQGEIIVAQGTPPEKHYTITYPSIQKDQSSNGWLADRQALDSMNLQSIFAAKNLADIRKSLVLAKAVEPGEILVEIQTNQKAKTGKDVYSTTLEVIEEPLPILGDNVRLNPDNGCIEAIHFGYLLLIENRISVMPPVWVSPDRQAAYYLNIPQLSTFKSPTAQELRRILSASMGLYEKCIKQFIVDKLCDKLSSSQEMALTIKIAEALPPQPGKDAVFTLCFDPKQKAGTIRDDGSLDLRERNTVISVVEDTLIAEKTFATKGVPGCDLYGKPLKADSGTDVKIKIGSGVRTQKTADKTLYYAQKAGNINYTLGTLSVKDQLKISGDVDYKTGNLDVKSDLQINGSVLAGFKVKSEGSLTILGGIENGAEIFAGGDLIVEKGIIGKDTKVVVLGDLNTFFIQDAEVIVKGDVIVRNYLLNCLLRANGLIRVLKGKSDKSGRIIGETVCSSKKLELSVAGSTSNTATTLAIQADPEVVLQLQKIESQGQAVKESISKISRSLPFDSFDPGHLKVALAKFNQADRKIIVQLLTNLNILIKDQQLLKTQEQKIRQKISSTFQQASIAINHEIFRGCEIQIAEKIYRVEQDMGPTVFRFHDGMIVH
jgi:uncharacterized protein (DUF342 family)